MSNDALTHYDRAWWLTERPDVLKAFAVMKYDITPGLRFLFNPEMLIASHLAKQSLQEKYKDSSLAILWFIKTQMY